MAGQFFASPMMVLLPACDFGEVIPVTSIAVERNVAVGQEQIEIAVVVEVAELRAEAPAAELDANIARQIFILE